MKTLMRLSSLHGHGLIAVKAVLKRTLAICTLTAILSGPAFAQTQAPATESDESYEASSFELTVRNSTRIIQILPPAVSKSLEIARMPTSEPIPWIFGTYWKCITHVSGFDVCTPVLVACTNDQSFCVEHLEQGLSVAAPGIR